jgi:hypothetical protein
MPLDTLTLSDLIVDAIRHKQKEKHVDKWIKEYFQQKGDENAIYNRILKLGKKPDEIKEILGGGSSGPSEPENKPKKDHASRGGKKKKAV